MSYMYPGEGPGDGGGGGRPRGMAGSAPLSSNIAGGYMFTCYMFTCQSNRVDGICS